MAITEYISKICNNIPDKASIIILFSSNNNFRILKTCRRIDEKESVVFEGVSKVSAHFYLTRMTESA